MNFLMIKKKCLNHWKKQKLLINSLRLLNLPNEVLKLVKKKISSGHAKILVGLDNALFVATRLLKKIVSQADRKFVKI